MAPVDRVSASGREATARSAVTLWPPPYRALLDKGYVQNARRAYLSFVAGRKMRASGRYHRERARGQHGVEATLQKPRIYFPLLLWPFELFFTCLSSCGGIWRSTGRSAYPLHEPEGDIAHVHHRVVASHASKAYRSSLASRGTFGGLHRKDLSHAGKCHVRART